MMHVDLIRVWCDEKGYKSIISSEYPVGKDEVRASFIIISKPWHERGITVRFFGDEVHYRSVNDNKTKTWPPWELFLDISNPEFFLNLSLLVEKYSFRGWSE